SLLFFFPAPPSSPLYPLSLHDALPISLAVVARRSAGQALQEKEQVLDKFCRIGSRQVTAHHQASDACKRQPDDRAPVTDTLQKVVAEERADHTAKTMGQMRRA